MRPNRVDSYLWPLVKGRLYAVTLAVIWVGLFLLDAELRALPWTSAVIAALWVAVCFLLGGSRRRYLVWVSWLSSAPETRPGFRRAAKGNWPWT